MKNPSSFHLHNRRSNRQIRARFKSSGGHDNYSATMLKFCERGILCTKVKYALNCTPKLITQCVQPDDDNSRDGGINIIRMSPWWMDDGTKMPQSEKQRHSRSQLHSIWKIYVWRLWMSTLITKMMTWSSMASHWFLHHQPEKNHVQQWRCLVRRIIFPLIFLPCTENTHERHTINNTMNAFSPKGANECWNMKIFPRLWNF